MAEQLIAVSEEQFADAVRRTALIVIAELRDDRQDRTAPEIMTKEMVADYIQCHPSSVNRYMIRETDPIPYEMGRNGDWPRFRKAAVDKWMQGH